MHPLRSFSGTHTSGLTLEKRKASDEALPTSHISKKRKLSHAQLEANLILHLTQLFHTDKRNCDLFLKYVFCIQVNEKNRLPQNKEEVRQFRNIISFIFNLSLEQLDFLNELIVPKNNPSLNYFEFEFSLAAIVDGPLGELVQTGKKDSSHPYLANFNLADKNNVYSNDNINFGSYKHFFSNLNLGSNAEDEIQFNLSSLDLSNFIFLHSNLSGVNFSGSTLTQSQFDSSLCSECDFSGANLVRSLLVNSNFSCAKFNHTWMQGSILKDSQFDQANFNFTLFDRDTNFTFAQFTNAQLNDDAKLSVSTHFFMENDRLSPYKLIEAFSRKRDEKYSNFITTIDSISNEILKKRLMIELIYFFENSNYQAYYTFDVHLSLCHHLLARNSFIFDNRILPNLQKFFKIMLNNILILSRTKCHYFTVQEASRLLSFFSSYFKSFIQEVPFFILESSLINQLIYSLRRGLDNSVISIRNKFEMVYLKKLPPTLIEAAKDCFMTTGDLDEATKDDSLWLKDHLLFLKIEEKQINQFLLVPESYYQKHMLKEKVESSFPNEWESAVLHYFTKNEEGVYIRQPDYNLQKLFNNFPLFRENYIRERYNGCLNGFFSILNLKEFKENFLNALDSKTSTIKLTGIPENEELEKIFNPLMQLNLSEDRRTARLKSTVFQEIVTIYKLNEISLENKIMTFSCLSAIFVNLSSKYHFGTETFSPNSLRHFALALLNEAIEFEREYHGKSGEFYLFSENDINHPFLVNSKMKPEDIGLTWKSILIGEKDPTCSALLYKNMVDSHLNPSVEESLHLSHSDQALRASKREVFSRTMPYAWAE